MRDMGGWMEGYRGNLRIDLGSGFPGGLVLEVR